MYTVYTDIVWLWLLTGTAVLNTISISAIFQIFKIIVGGHINWITCTLNLQTEMSVLGAII